MTRSRSPRRPLALLATAALSGASLAALTPAAATASSPADSGTLTPPASGAVTAAWSGQVAGANAMNDCTAAPTDAANDHHTFTVTVPAGFYDTHDVVLAVSETAATADSILSVNRGTAKLGSSDSGSVGGSESFTLPNPDSGGYDAITCAFAGSSTYTATVTLTTKPKMIGGVTGGTSTTAGPSAYANYPLVQPGTSTPLPGVGPPLIDDGSASSGEPSIGVDWGTGDVFFQSNLDTYRARFPGTGTAAPAFTNVSCTETTLNTLDPIMFTDSVTGRVGTSQLAANPALVNSVSTFFDAKSNPTGPQAACTPSTGGGQVAGPDHQTLGGGPFPKPLPTGVIPSTTYPRAFYYCSQTIVEGAFCARSDNGGSVFTNTGFPPYTTECGGLHGHIRIAPDGTAYLPNKACGQKQGFAVSSDAGQTWTIRTVPGSSAGATDPSVSADRAGTAFLGYVDGDNHPKIATTRDKGATFSQPVDVGQALGIQNAVFAEVIAGDPGRAAFAFLGTPTGGNRDALTFGKNSAGTAYDSGDFHLYVATTIDGGQSYNTVDATPTDPVQRGSICTQGTTCMGGTRNLLDFNDIVVDKTGHVLVGYSDGCTAACVTSNTVANNKHTALGTIARQVDGPLLFVTPVADGPSPAVAEAPLAIGLPLVALVAATGFFVVRRRRSTGSLAA